MRLEDEAKVHFFHLPQGRHLKDGGGISMKESKGAFCIACGCTRQVHDMRMYTLKLWSS